MFDGDGSFQQSAHLEISFPSSNYPFGQQPTVTKLMPDQQPITKMPIQTPTTVPDSEIKETYPLESHYHHKSHSRHESKNNANCQERYEKSENSTISTSPEQDYPKKLLILLLVTRIYNIATERLFTESKFLEKLYNVLLQTRSMMFVSQRPIFCSTRVNGLGICIKTSQYTIPEINELMDSLQQLMDQKTSFGKKLEKENCYVKDVIHKYRNLGKDENLLQSGYLATIETIESTSQGIQRVWCSYLESPVMLKHFPNAEHERCESFAVIFAAIFDMVISLNKDCNNPDIWSDHIEMEELMEKFQSFSTVGVCN